MEEHLTLPQIADIFEEIAVLLELKGENHFKVRAFQNAARSLKNSDESVEDFVNQLQDGGVKGFGPQLSESVLHLYQTGELPYYGELKAAFPESLLDLLDIPGLGAKKIKTLYSERKISSLDELEAACREGSLSSLKGFGEKTVQNILSGIERLREYRSRFRFDTGRSAAEALLQYVEASDACECASIAGSLRRGMETVKDIDIVASSREPETLSEYFAAYPDVETITAQGTTKTSVILRSGIGADLRIVEPEAYPTALLHFTGSKEHNTALRGRAKQGGRKLNEYGLFKDDQALQASSEQELYHQLDLAYIPPEMRENLGEIELAESAFSKQDELPPLVEQKDIQGVLHAHTTYSDGKASLQEMAEALQAAGYHYFGVSDHSQSAAYAGGLTQDDIKRQHEEIDRLNEKMAPFKIFKGIESDILADGALDYSEDVLSSFDFVIASIHSQLTMKRNEMMKRLENAIANPHTTILGHVSTRRLLRRDAADIDIPRVLELAASHRVAIELNCNPQRLDLDWRFCRAARELEIPIPLCPDAHSISGIDDLQYGIVFARKGWLTPADVLNCRTAAELEAYFKSKKAG